MLLLQHYVMINEEYVFASEEKGAINLIGYYVHGRTGEVRIVDTGGILKWSDHPEWSRLWRESPQELRQGRMYPGPRKPFTLEDRK